MKFYFRYLGKLVLNKISIWVTIALYWLLALIILIIVPFAANISPLTIWGNTLFDIQSGFIIIAGAISALIVVNVFKRSIEDQSELLIQAKPLKRWKITFIKFLWTLIFISIITFGMLVIGLMTYILGPYNANYNPKGIDYHKVWPLICTLVLATYIINCLFCSIAIFISLIANRVQIIVTLIAANIVLSVYNNMSRFVLTRLDDSINQKLSTNVSISSFNATDFNNNKTNFSYLKGSNEVGDTDLYPFYSQSIKSTNQIYMDLNFMNQLSSLFQLFDVTSLKQQYNSTRLGSNERLNTKLIKDNTFSKYLMNQYISLQHASDIKSTNYPLSIPSWNEIINSDQGQYGAQSDTGFYNLSINLYRTDLLNLIGGNTDTLWIYNKDTFYGLAPAKWAYYNEFITNENLNYEFNKHVFKTIIIPLLTDKNEAQHNINLCNLSSDDDLKKYLNIFYNRIYNDWNQSISDGNKFHFDTNKTLDVINFNLARYRFSLIQSFLYIYWHDLICDYLKENNISINQYLINQNKVFNQQFKAKLTKIVDPYTHEDITIENGMTYSQYLHVLMTFGGLSWFTEKSYYNRINKSIRFSQYPIKLNTSNNTVILDDSNTEKYATFPLSWVSCYKQDLGININYFYQYKTYPYVSNVASGLIWSLLTLLLSGLAYCKYQRIDIS